MPESEDWPAGRPEESSRTARARDARTGSAAAANRMRQQHTWVDLQIRQAIERGEFDDLPGAGKPIEGLGAEHDPDWWIKRLVERERIAVLPPAIQLRKDDAALDARLDELWSEDDVRREVQAFNARVIRARLAPGDWPPLVTQPRDVEDTVAAWRDRRTRRTTQEAERNGEQASPPPVRHRRWWRRGGGD